MSDIDQTVAERGRLKLGWRDEIVFNLDKFAECSDLAFNIRFNRGK